MLPVRLCLAALCLLAAGQAAAREWKTARIATDGASPPFSLIDANRQPQGFEVEIVRAICDKAKIRCDIVALDADQALATLAARKIDAVAALLPITEDLKKRVDFTDRYYTLSARFIGRTGFSGATGPGAMKGRSIGARAGTPAAAFLADTYKSKDITVRLFPSEQALAADLAASRIDLALADPAALYDWLTRGEGARCCDFVGNEVKDARYFGDGAGIAVRKTDGDLRAQLNKGLADMLRDGTYERLNRRYFPFAAY